MSVDLVDWRQRGAVTPAEAAAILHIGRRQAYELAASGTLPTVRIGRSIRFTVAGIRAFLAEAADDAAA